jgi:hypothetical protein
MEHHAAGTHTSAPRHGAHARRAQFVSAVDVGVSPDGRTVTVLFVYGKPPYPTNVYYTQVTAGRNGVLARLVDASTVRH